jgi:hypothetical protein
MEDSVVDIFVGICEIVFSVLWHTRRKSEATFFKRGSTTVQVSELGNITGSNPTFTDIVRKSKGRQMKHLRISWERNFVPKKFRGIDSEWLPLFRGRKCLLRGIPSSAEEPIPKLGTERNFTKNEFYKNNFNKMILSVLQKLSFLTLLKNFKIR